ncbi:MAG TPA: adenosine deaminase [Actinomycetota bacterium]
MRDLRSLPKVELHVHLEGSVRPATLRELADRDGLALPHGLGEDDVWRHTNPDDFIRNYTELCSLLRRPEDFRRIAEEFCADLAATGVRYAEAVFSPSNHAVRMGGDHHGPIEAVLDGLRAGARETGVAVGLTPDVVRDMGVEEAERVLEVALAFADRGVVALNGAGSEKTDVATYAPVFQHAKAAGLRRVPHAGEWAGPENVWETLRWYDPDRIGHGVRSIDDPALVEELARRAIPLEVCPVSNVATGAYPSLAVHPFPALRAAGVVVSLHSDDPPMFGGWLTEVYAAAREAWSLTDEDLAELARVSVRSSFAGDDVKTSVLDGIDRWLADGVSSSGS